MTIHIFLFLVKYVTYVMRFKNDNRLQHSEYEFNLFKDGIKDMSLSTKNNVINRIEHLKVSDLFAAQSE